MSLIQQAARFKGESREPGSTGGNQAGFEVVPSCREAGALVLLPISDFVVGI